MVAFRLPSGIANISILRERKFSDYKFLDMKAKVITTICAIVGALALFVFIPSEASTSGTQILWSGSWLIVLLLCAKGIDKYGEDEQ